jgi:molybdopterin synthase sulfur carrier subunit
LSVTVTLPAQLRELAGGRTAVSLEGDPSTVDEALRRLRMEWPAVYDRIATEQGEIRPHVNLFVNGDEIRRTGGVDTPVEAGGEIFILPSVSGG